MVYLQEDFYSTLVGSKDPNDRASKILSEVADLIANNKESVIEALNASGVNTPANATDKRIINDLVINSESNPKLQMGIAYLIADKNSLIADVSASDGQGSGVLEGLKGGAGGAAGGAGAGPIGAIVGAIAGAFGSVMNFKASKSNAEAQADATRGQLAMMVLQKKQGGSKTGLYVVLGVVLVGAAILWLTLKKKK